jgi:hypothetical protein
MSTVGNKNIMDNALIWSTNAMTSLHYFRCFCEIYKKYRLSFNPKKCDFFKPRFEWLGHDVQQDGNSPAASKFNLVADWPLPENGFSFSSFLGLVTFYNWYIGNYDARSRPLRELSKRFHRVPIPPHAWTPQLCDAFTDLKLAITSDPCLARFDSSLPTFLKTDWSASGMSYVFMQPADDPSSRKTHLILEAGGPNTFDELMTGARLRPVRFGSRRCTDRERHFHSFVGEAVTGRWAIGQCRRYLWGGHFYWLCDCNSLKELLDYTGNIHQICCIAQELLGYFFTFVHRPARMMRDVDGLNRFYDPLIREYEERRETARLDNQRQHPNVYVSALFPECAVKCPDTTTAVLLQSTQILHAQARRIPKSISQHAMTTAPPFFGTNYPVNVMPSNASTNNTSKAPNPIQSSSVDIAERCCPSSWISLGSQCGSLANSFAQLNPLMSLLPCLLLENSVNACAICKLVVPSATIVQASLAQFSDILLSMSHSQQTEPTIRPTSPNVATVLRFLTASSDVAGIDLHASASSSTTLLLHWLHVALRVVDWLSQLTPLRCFLLTVPLRGNMESVSNLLSSALFPQLRRHSANWNFRCGELSPSFFGDPVHARVWIAFGLRADAMDRHPTFPPTVDAASPLSQCIDVSMHRSCDLAFTFDCDQQMWSRALPSSLSQAE